MAKLDSTNVYGDLVVTSDLTVVNKITLDADRPIYIQSGQIRIQASAGGWADAFGFYGSSATDWGGFGGFGTDNNLTYYYIGKAHNDIAARFYPDAQVDLCYNDSIKLSTSNTGVSITGAATATSFSGPLTGDVTGNVSGSSGSCTGNAATATTAGSCSGNAATATKLAGINTTFSGTYPMTVNVTGTIYSHTGCTFTGSTGTLAATIFDGNLTGNVTGNVSGSSGSCTGNAATATWADTVDVNASNTGAGEYQIMWNSGDTVYSTTGITLNRDAKRITATTFSGALTGNVTGNVSGSSGSCTGNAATATTASQVTCTASDSNSTYQMLWRSGNAVYYTAGVYCNPSTDYLYAANFQLTSDVRLKTKIVPIPISSVDVEYKQFELKDNPGKTRYGVIAQDLQKTNPELVDEGADGMLTVSYIDLLIKEITALKARVEELEKNRN